MKLHIPTMLLTALLAVQATYTAKADYINGGVFYDVGKETCSNKPNPRSDREFCWATTGANMVQYWQDTYSSYADKDKPTPSGLVDPSTPYTPTGTDYLQVYDHFLAGNPVNKTGSTSNFCDWFFKGKEITGTIGPEENGGFYTGAFSDMDKSATEVMSNFDTGIINAFKDAGGSVGLTVNQTNQEGKTIYSHAVTCWGYEAKDGQITSLILSDSDDQYFGTFRVDVKHAGSYIYLITDHNSNELWCADYELYKNSLASITYITTPGDPTPSTDNPAKAAIESDPDTGNYVVKENTRLASEQTLNTGVTVGNNETVVVLTSKTGKGLIISAEQAKAETGLHITSGAMASLSSLEVSGFKDSGIVTDGHLYVGDVNADATLNVHDNSTDGNGGGVQNNTFLDISNCAEVSFTNNEAAGKGGAIYTKGNDDPTRPYYNTTVSIRGNGTVVFSGNTAQEGNDIYVEKGSYLNIADNDSVLFQGTDSSEAAIVNKGTTYLAAAMDIEEFTYTQTIGFDKCSLDSREGTVVIGGDINNQGDRGDYGYLGYADFKDNDDHQLSIACTGSAAELRNVWIDATGITGVGVANSLISSVYTDTLDEGHKTTGYTLENLTLDTTNRLGASEAITLNNVNIALGEGDFDQDHTFDITKLLQTTTNFNGAITFDASSLGLQYEEPPTEIKVKIKEGLEVALLEQAKLTLLIGGYEYGYNQVEQGYMVFNNPNPIVPEPATGTLSLLALAGLCARRRRK